MTTIAATTKEIACDCQLSHSSGIKFKTNTKLYKVDNKLLIPEVFYFGYAGSPEDCLALNEWFQDPKEKPPRSKNTEYLALTQSGKLYTFLAGRPWVLVDQPYYAIGSGSHLAMGMMAVGKSPSDAIKEVSKIDPSTGMGVKKYSL